MRTRDVAASGALAALYAALVVALEPISFLQVQVRVADALTGLVPVMGWPAIVGLTLGTLIGNLVSPLGPLDLLSAVPEFFGLYAVWILRRRSVPLGLSVCAAAVSAWVALLLEVVLGLPYLPSLAYVLAGSLVSTVAGGYAVYLWASRALAPLWGGEGGEEGARAPAPAPTQT